MAKQQPVIANDSLCLILRPGKINNWEVWWTYNILWNGIEITIPTGTTTDFASCPWWIRWLLPKVGRNTRGAIVHDGLYRNPKIRKGIDRKLADQIFYDINKYYGMNIVKNFLSWLGVRIGGKSAWIKENDATNNTSI